MGIFDLYNPLRFQGIFGSGMQPPPQQEDAFQLGNNAFNPSQNAFQDPYSGLFDSPPIASMASQEPSIAELMRQYYQPQNDASDRFENLINQYPTREEPSNLRKIGASLMGLGQVKPHPGVNIAQMQEHFTQGPFQDKLQDWKEQIAPAQQAANLERYNNANERTLAYQMAGRDIQERDLQRKTATDQGNLEIRSRRADIYDWKAKHPGFKQMNTKGGNVMLYDPATGDSYDTGVASGSMTEESSIKAKGDQAVRAAGARGNEARKTKGTPSGGTGKELSPNQVKIDEYNRARQLSTMPEFRDFISIGIPGTNDFEIKPRVKGYFGTDFGSSGPSEEQLNRMGRFIYKDKWDSTQLKPVETVPAQGPQNRNEIHQVSPSTGKKRVSYDGGKTWRPE